VATVVAILLAGGVLLGFLSLVVDVGRIYVERQELQTGADAAALAIAKACATANPACATHEALLDLAQTYANANSSDGVSKVSGVCGRSAAALPSCGDPAGNLTDCLGGAPVDGPYVEVRVATQLPDGSLVLPPVFAQTMAGNGDFDGASVGACARATWQTPADTPIVGLAISTCEWANLTRGSRIGDDPRDEGVIFTQPGHGTCPGPVTPGWRRGGPAGWLAADASCEVHLPLSRVLPEASGSGAPTACQDRLRTAAVGHETIYLPVFDATRDGFPDPGYHIVAFAPFVPTGFVLGAATKGGATTPGGPVLASTLNPPDPPCSVGTAERCVSGVFPDPLVPVSTIAGDALVKLIG
jgi:Putative Flp pilus-assembly TadE/G-like